MRVCHTALATSLITVGDRALDQIKFRERDIFVIMAQGIHVVRIGMLLSMGTSTEIFAHTNSRIAPSRTKRNLTTFHAAVASP